MSGSLVSRREFTRGLVAVTGVAGGMALLGSRASAAAEFTMRQFHNQPADSPLHKRLVELWAAVEAETHGRVKVRTFADNGDLPGGDPAALKMIVDGQLDFMTLNGGLIGNVVPAANVQGLPFVFRNEAQVYGAMDGDLGEYLGEEMKQKGIYLVPRSCFENGFRQITCSTKPVYTVEDMQGIRMRSPDAPIYIQLFKLLGATPIAININKLYEALKTGQADAQDNPLNIAELFKLYEVQKYVSLTSHVWSGFNMIASLKVWQSLPADVTAVIERTAPKYAKLQRADNDKLNAELRTRLAQQGMKINQADASTFRSRLAPFYAEWKGIIGQQTWALLEEHVGKIA